MNPIEKPLFRIPQCRSRNAINRFVSFSCRLDGSQKTCSFCCPSFPLPSFFNSHVRTPSGLPYSSNTDCPLVRPRAKGEPLPKEDVYLCDLPAGAGPSLTAISDFAALALLAAASSRRATVHTIRIPRRALKSTHAATCRFLVALPAPPFRGFPSYSAPFAALPAARLHDQLGDGDRALAPVKVVGVLPDNWSHRIR